MERKIKKVLSVILSLLIITSGVGVGAVNDEQKVSIIFGQKNIVKNATINISGTQRINTFLGKSAIELGTADPNLYVSVNVDDKLIYAPEGTAVKISVEYFDKGKGKFSISYDGTHNGVLRQGVTDAEIVKLTDTGEWLTHDFLLDDIKCVNNYNDVDFRIGTWTDAMGISSEPVNIASITVEKTFPKHPMNVSVQSGHVGNIFGGDDDKKLNLNFKNVYNGLLNAKTVYKIMDSSNNEYLSEEKEFSIEKGEEYTYSIDANSCKKFDNYRLIMNTTYSGNVDGELYQSEDSRTINFSVVNKSDTTERSDRVQISTHMKNVDEEFTLIADGGFGGFRHDCLWVLYEKTKGSYTDLQSKEYQACIDLNLKRLCLPFGGNFLYEASRTGDSSDFRASKTVPITDEGIQGYANFAAYMVNQYKGVIDTIEVWNEYNIKSFNYEMADEKVYAKLLKATYTAVKKANPDIKVIALSPAGSLSTTKDFIENVLAAGGYDYMDAAVIHPYDGGHGEYRLNYLRDFVEGVRDIFRKYGEPKPVWLTEIGTPTAIGDSSSADEDRQAANFVRINCFGIGENLTERMYWYDLVDDGDDNTNREHRWGLVHSATSGLNAFTAKPSYIAAAAFNKMLGNAKLANKLSNDKNIYGYDFRDTEGEDTAVIWSENGQQVLGLSLGAKKIDLYDINSNHLGTMTSEDGIYNISTDIDAVYVKGKFDRFEEANTDISHDSLNITAVPSDKFEISLKDAQKRNLRTELDLSNTLSYEDSVDSDGNIRVSIKIPDNTSDSYKGRITLYDGDNLVYTSPLKISIENAVSLYATSSQISPNDSSHWQGDVHITNNSYSMPVSGMCRLVSVDGEARTTNTAYFKNIKSKQSVTLHINIPEQIKKRVTEVTFEVELSTGVKYLITQKIDFISAKYTGDDKPVIDGNVNLSEWKGTWATVDRKKEMTTILAGAEWKGKEDLSYDFNTMWDEENFYMSLIVTDDVHYQNEEPSKCWSADGIQFGIESNLNKNGVLMAPDTAVLYSNFTELGMAYNGKESYIYRFKSQDSKNEIGVVENCSIAAKREGNKTYYEMAIPWSEIFGKDFVINKDIIFNFAVLVNDNDGTGRKTYAGYNDGIGTEKNAYQFGKLSLAK